MSTTEKGNKLEDQLYGYLQDQIDRNQLVFDAHPPDLCQVYKKKKYFCQERDADVEFDIVVEIRRPGRTEPHLFIVFECKNHKLSVQERDVTDFSDKIGRILGHSAKGVVVTTSRLQSGAENVARNRRLGIIKFDGNGIDVVADRAVGPWTESPFLQAQMIDGARRSKSLKFSGCNDGRYFGSLWQMLQIIQQGRADSQFVVNEYPVKSIPFLPDSDIQTAAQHALVTSKYRGGEVNLGKLCAALEIDLTYSEQLIQDADGNTILGSANFSRNSIEVNQHGNRNRERFTVAHEIGHFYLGHRQYLNSDSIVESDLFFDADATNKFNFERLEYQANIFASMLLLPELSLRQEVASLRQQLNIYDRGFGYIFVDDQPCNYGPYHQILSSLSNHFGVSKQAIEIRLKRLGLVADERKTDPNRPGIARTE